MLRPPPGVSGPTLDVQVLEGLETYIATEQFLHKLEAASAEWIDLSEHQLPHPHPAGWPHDTSPSSSSVTDAKQQQQPAKAAGAEAAAGGSAASPPPPASAAPAALPAQRTSSGGGFFGLWRRSQPPAASAPSPDGSELPPTTSSAAGQRQASATAAAASSSAEGSAEAAAAGSSSGPSGAAASQEDAAATDSAAVAPPAVVAASVFELVGPQPPLAASSLQQEPFVLVSQDDAVEAMAYYIALYLSRAPEARNMEPRQLQAALKQTFTAIRRSRYRAIWDWGRCLYRWGAVSYSALQLYEHPWLVRAVVAAVWASSRMALGFLW